MEIFDAKIILGVVSAIAGFSFIFGEWRSQSKRNEQLIANNSQQLSRCLVEIRMLNGRMLAIEKVTSISGANVLRLEKRIDAAFLVSIKP